jgi:hypothetical protein
MLRALTVTLSLTAAFATSASAPSVGLMRLRGGADFKDKATGILFPEHLKAGGSDLQVSHERHMNHMKMDFCCQSCVLSVHFIESKIFVISVASRQCTAVSWSWRAKESDSWAGCCECVRDRTLR